MKSMAKISSQREQKKDSDLIFNIIIYSLSAFFC
jgi:hypothetical protein